LVRKDIIITGKKQNSTPSEAQNQNLDSYKQMYPLKMRESLNINDIPQDLLFISYSQRDKSKIFLLLEELDQCGIKVWIDARYEAEAQRFAKRIVQAIRTSKACAFMCSAAAYQSDHVVRELYLADRYKKPIIPVEIEPCSPTEDFEYFFSGFDFVPAIPTEECVQAIMRRLNDS
jgi:hypothetical protein